MKSVVQRDAVTDETGPAVAGAGALPVAGMAVMGGHTRLRAHRTGRPLWVTVPARPDVGQARRLRRVMRRISRVVLAIEHERVSCTIEAVGHRLPLTRPVSLGTALGLGLQGVPVLLRVDGI
jgi:hypothetical protein